MAKQKLFLIRGISGSGKTTMAKKLDAALVEADMFFINKDGEYQYDKRLIKNAHSWCQSEMTRLLLAGHDVVVANTFIKPWEIKNYLRAASALQRTIEVDVLEATGRYKNLHGVPEPVVEKMAKQYEQVDLEKLIKSVSKSVPHPCYLTVGEA